MAELVIIEDLAEVHDEIDLWLEGTNHQIVGEAYTLKEAHELLRTMALGELATDVVLLDANLKTFSDVDTDFSFLPPEHAAPLRRKRFLDRFFPPIEPPNPHEIVIPQTGVRDARDGRQISQIIRTLGLPVTIVGISLDPAKHWGPENNYVDYDLTKRHLEKLPSLLDSLTA